MPKSCVYGMDLGWANGSRTQDLDRHKTIGGKTAWRQKRVDDKADAAAVRALAIALARQAAAEARTAKAEEWSTPADAVHAGLVKIIGNNLVTRYSKKVLKMAENMALGYFLAGALPAGALFGAGAAMANFLSDNARIMDPMDALDESYDLHGGVHVGGGAVRTQEGPLRTTASAFYDLADATAALRRVRRGEAPLLLEDAPANFFETSSKTGTVQERTAAVGADLRAERVLQNNNFGLRSSMLDQRDVFMRNNPMYPDGSPVDVVEFRANRHLAPIPSWAEWIAEGFMHA